MKYIKTKIIVFLSVFAFAFIDSTAFATNFLYMYNTTSIYEKSDQDTSSWNLIYTGTSPLNPKYNWSDIWYIDSSSLWKKPKTWWTATNMVSWKQVINFNISPDWTKIVYTNASRSNKLYLKNSNDTSEGYAITEQSWDSTHYNDPFFSPDGNYIYYVSSSATLWKKLTTDTANWSQITSHNSIYSFTVSPDWNYIVYWQWGFLYKKSANDSNNGTKIVQWSWSNYNYFPSYSPDWNYITYQVLSWTYKLYRKSASDTQNWTEIFSSVKSSNIWYLLVPPATCTDWIKNQDEVYSTEHPFDYGGVCGTCSDWIQQTDVTNPEIAIDYGWRCTTSQEYRFDWCTQRTIKYYWTGATTVYNMWGLSNYSLFVADVSNESEWLKVFWLWQSKIEQYTFDDWTGLNYDLFKVYNIQYSDATAEQNNPQVNSGSLVVTSGGPLSAIKTDTTTGTPPSIEIYSMRSGVVRKFDFVRFTGANYPTITKWSQTNYAWYVTWNTQKGIISSPLVLSGWIATAYLSDWLLADSAVINLQQQNSKFNGVYFQFSWFSFWLSWWSLSVTECWNGDFKCKMYVESPTASPVCKPDSNSVLWIWEACVYTTAFTTPVVINDAGDITTVSWNACIPNRKQWTVVTPDWFTVDYVVDQSGSVIQQNTRPISTGDFTEQCLSSDPGILEYVKCSFQFVWNQIKQLTTTTEKTTDIINKAQTWVKPNETKTWSLELWQSQKQNTGNSLVNAVQNQYDAYDNGTDAFANVWTLMKWVLWAILTFVVILLFFALSGNRKQ